MSLSQHMLNPQLQSLAEKELHFKKQMVNCYIAELVLVLEICYCFRYLQFYHVYVYHTIQQFVLFALLYNFPCYLVLRAKITNVIIKVYCFINRVY